MRTWTYVEDDHRVLDEQGAPVPGVTVLYQLCAETEIRVDGIRVVEPTEIVLGESGLILHADMLLSENLDKGSRLP